MNHQARTWRRSRLAALMLAAAVVAAPLPAMAEDVHQPEPGSPGIAASAKKAVEATVLKASSAPRLAQDQAAAPRTDLGTSSFFKSPAGIITLVAVGVWVGYAFYSTSNDRIKSPAK